MSVARSRKMTWIGAALLASLVGVGPVFAAAETTADAAWAERVIGELADRATADSVAAGESGLRDTLGRIAGGLAERGDLAGLSAFLRASYTGLREIPNQPALLAAVREAGAGYRPGPRDSVHLVAALLLELSALDIRVGDHRACAARLDSIDRLPVGATLPADVRGAALYRRGYIAWFADDIARAAVAFADAAEAYREAGNAERLVAALDASGACYFETGDYDSALRLLRSAIRTERRLLLGDTAPPRNYNVRLNLAEALSKSGQRAAAERAAAEGLAIARSVGSADGAARGHHTAGRLALWHGDLPAAAQHLRDAAAGFALAGDVHLRNLVREDETALAERLGDYRTAYALSRKAARMRDSLRAAEQAETMDRLSAMHRAESELAEVNLLREQAARHEAERNARTLQLLALLAIALAGAAFAAYRMRQRQRLTRALEARVAERTAELEEKTRRLEASNRELERFAYIASHDLKTPLRNVTSFLDLIARRLPEEARPAVGEFVTHAQDYARRMHALVADVLEFSSIGSAGDACAPVELGAVIREQVRSSAPWLTARGASVEVVGEVLVRAPEQQLRRLFGNLITNGVTYNDGPAPRVRVELARTRDGGCRVEVTDDGIGIDAAYHARVFELFRRLHRADDYEGTGLGLAVCKKIAERLGGRIELTSAPGEGSTFAVCLPAERCAQVAAVTA